MTPQKEYTITEKQISTIEKGGWIDAFIVLEQVRSQKSPIPTASEIKTRFDLKEYGESIRNQTLDECRTIIGNKIIFNQCPYNGDCGQCFLCNNTGGCIVESLRTQKEKP